MVSVADFGGGGGGVGGCIPPDEMSLEWVMVSPILLPTSDEIDEAGRKLVSLRNDPERESEWLDAVHVVDQWRRAHSEPLRTFQANLRRRVKSRGIVATRLKRLPTIIGKLERLSKIEVISTTRHRWLPRHCWQTRMTDRVFKIATSNSGSQPHSPPGYTKLDDYIARPRTNRISGHPPCLFEYL